MNQPTLTCLDLEGVLVPEIWISVSEKTGIQELGITTRDIPDYDVLMKRRLAILDEHQIRLPDIRNVVETMRPLEGAYDFLTWLRERAQVVILSDTYYEFMMPLMKYLHYPTLFCHSLEIDETGRITDYFIRQADQKRKAVSAFRSLGFRVIAAGDSYNDTSMLGEADAGVFYRPPESIAKEFPQFPVAQSYDALKKEFCHLGPLRP